MHKSGYQGPRCGHCFETPNPYNSSEKYCQHTSNLYHSTPPICNAVPCWLLSLKERETPQYTSYLYRRTAPICTPICTVVHLPFVPAILLRNYQGLGVPESSSPRWGHGRTPAPRPLLWKVPNTARAHQLQPQHSLVRIRTRVSNRNSYEGGAPNFIRPTPENTLLEVGGCASKRGGVIKFLLRGGSTYTV